jgi:hypothetical protein
MSAAEQASGLRARTIAALMVAAALLGIVFGFSIFALFRQQAWLPGVQAQVFVLLATGVLVGALVTVVFLWMGDRETETSWVYVALFCVAVMAIAAARADQLSFVQALLIIIFGSVALVAATNALSLFRQGEAIELESSWGGLD